MRSKLHTATLSFALLKGGTVSVNSSTGALLERSLKGLTDLVDRSISEVRLESSLQRQETTVMAEFIEEMTLAATMHARRRSLQLKVEPVASGIVIQVDRQLLATAVNNLLQNAFKFSREHGRVRLRAHAIADRVFIDIEDECGGLPPGQVEALFRPFNQRSADRTGLGLGLVISRRAVHLNGGEIRVRDVPGKGCVFTVDLPRIPSEFPTTGIEADQVSAADRRAPLLVRA
jgi:signal transduction histidine kinase